MLRLLLSATSALVLVAFYFFLAGVPSTLAAESESVLAAGNPPLTRDASAHVSRTITPLRMEEMVLLLAG